MTAASPLSRSDVPSSSPRAAAASASSRSPSSRGISTCVSGSPKRALNSSTRGPSSVSIRPAKRQPTNGVPRRASSSITGWWIRSTSASASSSQRHRRVGAHAAGVRARVAVAGALEVLSRPERRPPGGRRRARRARPPAPRAAPRSRSSRRGGALAQRRLELGLGVADEDALACREAVGLDDARRPRGSRARPASARRRRPSRPWRSSSSPRSARPPRSARTPRCRRGAARRRRRRRAAPRAR